MTHTIPFLSTLHARENTLTIISSPVRIVSAIRSALTGLLDGRYPCKPGRRNPNYAQCVDSLCFYNDWGWEAVNIPSDFQAPQLLEPVIETQAWELRNCGIDRSSPVVTLVTISTDKKNFHYLIK